MREETPIETETLPEQVKRYMTFIQTHEKYEFVSEFFYQVTWLDLPMQNQTLSFFVLEFRDGFKSALTWEDDDCKWGVGGWVQVAHEDADITCSPSVITEDYFRSGRPANTFMEALQILNATKN